MLQQQRALSITPFFKTAAHILHARNTTPVDNSSYAPRQSLHTLSLSFHLYFVSLHAENASLCCRQIAPRQLPGWHALNLQTSPITSNRYPPDTFIQAYSSTSSLCSTVALKGPLFTIILMISYSASAAAIVVCSALVS